MSLTSLPNELVFHSASYLPTSSLNALFQTNRNLNYVLTPILYARALDPAISGDVLCYAVAHNSLAITRYLLANNVFATTAAELCDEDCCSPVQVAAAKGFVSVVREFVEHDPTLNVQAHDVYPYTSGQSPMMLAAANGHLNVVRLFTDHYTSFKWENYPMFTKHDMDFYRPLKLALRNFHDPIIRFLLHHLGPEYWSRIFPHVAAAGLCELLEELLPLLTHHRHEAVSYGLEAAATNGHLRCVEQLVEHVDKTELQLALQAGARAGHDGVVVYLLELFEDQAEASTATLYDAVMGGSRDLLNLLLAYGCDVNASLKIPCWKTGTILHWIARISGRQVGLDRICAMVLEAGADRYPDHEDLRNPHSLTKRYPTKENTPASQALWTSYSGVQKALLNGDTSEIVSKYIEGRFGQTEVVWHDHGFVKRLAEKVDVKFVEGPRWF